jgi:hypothetical protein
MAFTHTQAHSPPVPKLTSATPVVRYVPDPAAVQVAQLLAQHQQDMTTFSLPNHCTQISGATVCVPRIALDGRLMPDLVLLSDMVASAEQLHLSLDSPLAARAAAAMLVCQSLLYRQGIRDGLMPSSSEVHAMVAQQRALALYARSTAPSSAAASASVDYKSGQYLATITHLLVANKELNRILVHATTAAERLATLRQWLQAQLAYHTVTINGVTQSPSTIAAAFH